MSLGGIDRGAPLSEGVTSLEGSSGGAGVQPEKTVSFQGASNESAPSKINQASLERANTAFPKRTISHSTTTSAAQTLASVASNKMAEDQPSVAKSMTTGILSSLKAAAKQMAHPEAALYELMTHAKREKEAVELDSFKPQPWGDLSAAEETPPASHEQTINDMLGVKEPKNER